MRTRSDRASEPLVGRPRGDASAHLSISLARGDSQRRWSPRANWVSTIHHGLPLADVPFRREPGSYLALVGQVAAEKGVAEAIELARTTGMPLRLAAKVYDEAERALPRWLP